MKQNRIHLRKGAAIRRVRQSRTATTPLMIRTHVVSCGLRPVSAMSSLHMSSLSRGTFRPCSRARPESEYPMANLQNQHVFEWRRICLVSKCDCSCARGEECAGRGSDRASRLRKDADIFRGRQRNLQVPAGRSQAADLEPSCGVGAPAASRCEPRLPQKRQPPLPCDLSDREETGENSPLSQPSGRLSVCAPVSAALAGMGTP